MFNLITDLVGGVRVSVLEEEVLVRRPRRLEVDRPLPPVAIEPAEPDPGDDEAVTETLAVSGNGDLRDPSGPIRTGTPVNGIPRRVSVNGDHSNGTPRPAPEPSTWSTPTSTKVD